MGKLLWIIYLYSGSQTGFYSTWLPRPLKSELSGMQRDTQNILLSPFCTFRAEWLSNLTLLIVNWLCRFEEGICRESPTGRCPGGSRTIWKRQLCIVLQGVPRVDFMPNLEVETRSPQMMAHNTIVAFFSIQIFHKQPNSNICISIYCIYKYSDLLE